MVKQNLKMSQKTTSLLLLLLSVISIAKSSSIKDFSREWTFGNLKQHNIDYSVGKNNAFVYDDGTSRPEKMINLTINYEYFNADGIVYHKQCRLDLISETASDSDFRMGINYFKLNSHRGLKVIFSYIDYIKEYPEKGFDTKMVHGIMDMETCKYKIQERNMKEMKDTDSMDLYFMLFPSYVQHNDDSYGIFMYDRNLCKAARCRQLVDTFGTLKDDLVPYLPEEYSRKIIEMHPTEIPDHYFAVARNKKGSASYVNDTTVQNYDLSLMYATPDGKVQELQHIPRNEKNIYHVDSSNGHIALCWTNSRKIHCSQYNSKKMKTLDETMEMSYEPKMLRVANLMNGGLILLTSQDKNEDGKNSSVYQLRKVNPNGDIDPTVELDDFNMPDDKDWKLTDRTNLSNEDKKNVCVSVVLTRIRPSDTANDPMKLKLMRKCLDNKYLKPIERTSVIT